MTKWYWNIGIPSINIHGSDETLYMSDNLAHHKQGFDERFKVWVGDLWRMGLVNFIWSHQTHKYAEKNITILSVDHAPLSWHSIWWGNVSFHLFLWQFNQTWNPGYANIIVMLLTAFIYSASNKSPILPLN